MQTCFVNTTEKPIEVKRLGFFSYVEKENHTYFSELCECIYRHPDAPDIAVVSNLEWLAVEMNGIQAAMYVIDAMKSLREVSRLK